MGIKRHLVLFIGVIPIVMFGLVFAMPPLYSWYCEVAGINQIQKSERVSLVDDKNVYVEKDNSPIVAGREIKVEFDSTIHDSLKEVVTEFHSLTPSIKIKLGEVATLSYIVKNSGTTALRTQAVPSITPWWGTEHLKKIECFCFQQQTLAPGEKKNMELRFYLDKDFPQNIQSLTLSYTLMKAKEDNDFSGAR